MEKRQKMKVCMDCKREYEPIGTAGILLHVCRECLATNAAKPEPYVQKNGLFVPNPLFKMD